MSELFLTVTMANIFTKIQRKVNQKQYVFLPHCLEELDDENFTVEEAVNAVLSPDDYFEFSNDESHIRYCFQGAANDGRMLNVIVFLHQGLVYFKTVYEM